MKNKKLIKLALSEEQMKEVMETGIITIDVLQGNAVSEAYWLNCYRSVVEEMLEYYSDRPEEYDDWDKERLVEDIYYCLIESESAQMWEVEAWSEIIREHDHQIQAREPEEVQS